MILRMLGLEGLATLMRLARADAPVVPAAIEPAAANDNDRAADD